VLSRLRRWFLPTRQSAAPPPVLQPGRLDQYARLCRACGVDRLYLLLTFDCDTDLDIGVVGDLDRDLRRRGIAAGYAVPGAQLVKGAATWRRLAENGAEFLNHGGRPHTEFREGRYQPVTFYDQIETEAVVADIQLGHRLVTEVIDVSPRGFRAPHFGSYQRPEQLEVIYSTVGALGYTYCSTTLPATALSRGPVVAVSHGLVELPTMGSYRNPTTLLDSWTYLTDRTNYALGDEYFELFAETVERMTTEGLPGLLTYYADPSHVVGQKPFERALDLVTKYGIPALRGHDVVRLFTPVQGEP
jgi:peptidoglycan/xylan/chitin deacetylase (PgdA/CDA1 family)